MDKSTIEVPYRIIIRNYDLARDQARQIIERFAALILEMSARGVPVAIVLKKSG